MSTESKMGWLKRVRERWKNEERGTCHIGSEALLLVCIEWHNVRKNERKRDMKSTQAKSSWNPSKNEWVGSRLPSPLDDCLCFLLILLCGLDSLHFSSIHVCCSLFIWFYVFFLLNNVLPCLTHLSSALFSEAAVAAAAATAAASSWAKPFNLRSSYRYASKTQKQKQIENNNNHPKIQQ